MDIKILNDIFSEFARDRSVIITGSIGSGKTTLLNFYLKDKTCRRITSYKKPSKDIVRVCIYIEEKNQEYTIAEFSKNGKTFFANVFDSELLSYLRNLSPSNDLLVIDEIGFIESRSERYLDELHRLFQSIRCIFVSRKERGALWQRFDKTSDFVFDVDDFIKW